MSRTNHHIDFDRLFLCCRFVENFEDILVKLISSQNFIDQLSIAEDDVALLATPVGSSSFL